MEQITPSCPNTGTRIKVSSIIFVLALLFVVSSLVVLQLFFQGSRIQSSNFVRLSISFSVVIFIGLVTLINPFWGLNFFAAFLPVQVLLAQKGVTNGLIITFGEIIIVLIFLLRRKKVSQASGTIVFYGMFFVYCFISALFTIRFSDLLYSYQTLIYLLNTFGFGLVFYVMQNHLKASDISAIIKVYVYGWFLICIWLILNYPGGRLGISYGFNPNSIAPYITFACIFGLTDYIHSKVAKSILVLTFVLALALTGTRTGLFGLIVGIASLFLFSRDFKKRIVILILIALGGVIAFSFLNRVSPELLSRYQLSGSLNNLDRFSSNRFEIWETSLQVFRQNPIVGVGFGDLGNYTAERSSLYDRDSIGVPSHNMYLDVLAELGGVGAFFFLIFIGSLFVSTVAKLKISSLSLCVFITFLAIGLTGSFFINLPLSIFFIGANTPIAADHR